MLKQLHIKLEEYWFGYDEYYVFYDDEYMTSEQAEKALEFIDWGSWEPELTPYYFIIPAKKKPILSCIKKYFTNNEYDTQMLGKWVLEKEPDGKPYCFHCSVCDDEFSRIDIKVKYPYCPYCGAKMDVFTV